MIEWIKRKANSWRQKEKVNTWKEQKSTSYTQRDMFFANMSHEIRIPVNGIVGFTQLLKETKLDKEQDELVNTIHSSSMHLLGLVNDILDFSKINARKMTLEETTFDLLRQVEDTVESYAAVAEEKGIALHLYVEPEIPPMLAGDSSKLAQVLINLLSNAIKFTDALGRVDVTVEKVMEGQKMATLRFAIKDNGIGISSSAQKNIFNAFTQANSSISRKFGGTGLGLAISSELVKLMGGELSVESVPDEGSEFSFTLSFEKIRSEERKIYADLYRGLNAGIVLSRKDAASGSEENLKRYLTYLGIDVRFYSSVEIVAMDKKLLPALLFANNSLAAAVQGALSGMDEKMILISPINRRKSASLGDVKHCGIIFEPLNLTKTIGVLEECLDDTSTSMEVAATVNRNFKGYKALVVDDNAVNQKLMTRVLENMQMDVEVVSDGEEALSCCQYTHFDILFMDIQMPVMDGIEAAKKIVALEQMQGRAHTPIIALTGNTDSKETQRYMDAGMDGFMAKPFDMDVMLSYLNTYTVGKKLMHQIERSKIASSDTKALIVEENSINQRVVERALASRGVESTLIGRGSLLLDTYKGNTYHILFISVDMPRISASVLIQEIRAYEAEKGLNAVPIVLIASGNVSESECSGYREAGANGCLYRPLDIDEIKQELDRCLEYREERVDMLEGRHVEVPKIPEDTVAFATGIVAFKDRSILEQTADTSDNDKRDSAKKDAAENLPLRPSEEESEKIELSKSENEVTPLVEKQAQGETENKDIYTLAEERPPTDTDPLVTEVKKRRESWIEDRDADIAEPEELIMTEEQKQVESEERLSGEDIREVSETDTSIDEMRKTSVDKETERERDASAEETPEITSAGIDPSDPVKQKEAFIGEEAVTSLPEEETPDTSDNDKRDSAKKDAAENLPLRPSEEESEKIELSKSENEVTPLVEKQAQGETENKDIYTLAEERPPTDTDPLVTEVKKRRESWIEDRDADIAEPEELIMTEEQKQVESEEAPSKEDTKGVSETDTSISDTHKVTTDKETEQKTDVAIEETQGSENRKDSEATKGSDDKKIIVKIGEIHHEVHYIEI